MTNTSVKNARCNVVAQRTTRTSVSLGYFSGWTLSVDFVDAVEFCKSKEDSFVSCNQRGSRLSATYSASQAQSRPECVHVVLLAMAQRRSRPCARRRARPSLTAVVPMVYRTRVIIRVAVLRMLCSQQADSRVSAAHSML